MQELSNAIIEFFDLVIEKYITNFANPKREWNYFKSLLSSSSIDLNRIQSYLKVLKNSADQQKPTLRIDPIKMENYMTYVSPLRDHNRPFEQQFNHKFENVQLNQYLSQPRLENNPVDSCVLFKKITSKIVNLMDSNNIQLALTKELQIQRPIERKLTDIERYKYIQQQSY
ncbi:unnamed protein product (macronuclear) [Paramecium tetraurelia]|uniref:Uncharacterized protein n=1 Tax=Paramecium tetraurelia TaxID=5888 RepID=A0CGT5_PARTE|nr:uncharacterized protein GSPATT00007442001 [Paramecium tetraurelia]CAK70002.1 unnamed protein product [Paramecium tetraurelia]|eukprot:XP_001437399.1 hypothetical protein (macronuclear) [Paramecium tetraurelia strain d4-2]